LFNWQIIGTFTSHNFLFLLISSRSIGVKSGVKWCWVVRFGVNGVKQRAIFERVLHHGVAESAAPEWFAGLRWADSFRVWCKKF